MTPPPPRVLLVEDDPVSRAFLSAAVQALPATVDVETGSPLLMGTTVADFRGLWGIPPNARVVTANQPEAAFRELVSAVGSMARRLG
jgi:inosine-uridine nucleoside N-ribohydrolase